MREWAIAFDFNGGEPLVSEKLYGPGEAEAISIGLNNDFAAMEVPIRCKVVRVLNAEGWQPA